MNQASTHPAGEPVLIDPNQFPYFKAKTGIDRSFVCDPLVVAEIEHKFHAEKLAEDNKVRKDSVL